MAGVLPKDPAQRRRRNVTPGFEQLPPEGRDGPAPAWPFGTPSPAEKAKWEQLWKLPQAIKWEQLHAEDTVAMYVRVLIAAMDDVENSKLWGECRQLDAKLGISPKAMLNIRWTISSVINIDEPAPARPKKPKQRAYIPDTGE